jgi:hypothetical protein
MKADTLGVWVRANRKFYVLDTGIFKTQWPTERILKILFQRQILAPAGPEDQGVVAYEIMTLAKAREVGYETEIIQLFANHKTEEIKESKDPWMS